MREAVLAIRRLLRGETVAFGPSQSRLGNTTATPTPVYLLAAGPRMVELAGEVADGVLLMVGLDPRAIAAARRHLEAGARRGGRALAGFPTIFIVTIAVEDEAEARRREPLLGAPGGARPARRRRARAHRRRPRGHVFLFPAHTLEGGYDMPVREVEAIRQVVRPAV